MSGGVTRQVRTAGSADDEVSSASTSAAIVDRSSVGKLLVTGADRLDLLHRLSTNDLLNLKPFSAGSTVFTTDKGRIVDYVRLLVFPDSLLLLTSPGRADLLRSWVEKFIIMEDIQLKPITSPFAMFSLIGADVEVRASELFGRVPEANHFLDLQFTDISITVDHQKDPSGSAVNILVLNDHAPDALDRLLTAGKTSGITRMNNGVYECYRILHGIPREDCELSLDFNPYEVGLAHAISFTKGCYVGQEVIARLDTYQKVKRVLVRMSFTDCLSNYESPVQLSKGGEAVGVLTSLSSTQLGGGYPGLGIVRRDIVVVGDTLTIPGHPFEIKGIVLATFDRNSK